MSLRNACYILLLPALCTIAASAQTKKVPKADLRIISCGECNGVAVYLPKPAYPKVARATAVSGAVNVQVLIDRKGAVTQAKAVSGHPFLRSAAEKAALRARFASTDRRSTCQRLGHHCL
jgi:TonB family protein